ncbi:Arc family DNA-binding protein [Acidovorax sp. BL-A-41-H1]|uniref:Arc family DNA-binding protein n=1 Tax=Acidovorax sp. BL-A-41-H1 TaxID=3421102 RepID=UPI003F78C4CD
MATNKPQTDYQKQGVRIPKDLHERIHEAAAASGRSYNSELIARLESSFGDGNQGLAVFRVQAHGNGGVPADVRDPEIEMRRTANLMARANLEALRTQVMTLESQALDLEYKAMQLKLQAQELKRTDAPDWDAPLVHANALVAKMKAIDVKVATLRAYIREIESSEKARPKP